MFQSPLFHKLSKTLASWWIPLFTRHWVGRASSMAYLIVFQLFLLSVLDFCISIVAVPVEFSDYWWTFGQENYGLFKNIPFSGILSIKSVSILAAGRDLSVSGWMKWTTPFSKPFLCCLFELALASWCPCLGLLSWLSDWKVETVSLAEVSKAKGLGDERSTNEQQRAGFVFLNSLIF